MILQRLSFVTCEIKHSIRRFSQLNDTVYELVETQLRQMSQFGETLFDKEATKIAAPLSKIGVVPLILRDCDAKESRSFSSCKLDYREDRTGICLIHPFELFGRTFKKIQSKDMVSEESQRAMLCLQDFLTQQDYHSTCITSVLKQEDSKEAITDVLAEHLFSRLVPDHKYMVNKNLGDIKHPRSCSGPSTRRMFSIGHEDVWHGDPDILMNIPSVSIKTERPYETINDDDEEESLDAFGTVFDIKDLHLPLEEKCRISNIKTSTTSLRAQDVYRQTVAQTIVHSFVASSEHNLQNCLVPSLATNGHQISFYFYDCQNDILLRTLADMDIFSFNSFNPATICYLWLCLNYVHFGPYLSPSRIKFLKQSQQQSQFHRFAGDKLAVYKFETVFSSFPIKTKESIENLGHIHDYHSQFMLDEFQLDEKEFESYV